MAGFNTKEEVRTIQNALQRYFENAREEILSELQSQGYSDIISSVHISPELENIKIELKDDVEVAEDQDFFSLLAFGGAVKKGNDYRTIRPSDTVRKYIGTR